MPFLFLISWRAQLSFFVCFLLMSYDARCEETASDLEVLASADGEVREIEAGHSFHGEAFDDGPRQAAYLMNGMGNVHWKITTKSPMAQRFFDQGVAQLHGFWYFEAERSFRQVAALDSECAMAFWGMARANTKNEKRARGFIAQAKKYQDNASKLEKRLIEALVTQLEDKVDEKTIPKKKRMENYAKALEEIVLDYPKEIEVRAMLVLQLWENEKEGLPVQSKIALDAMLDDIFEKNPRHPAHHFRIHLWDNARRELALSSAAACGPAAAGIAHMWHMPGHTYSGLKRYHDAAWQQEASARVDHAHMMRDRVMPDQIHNFAHNNEWLIRTWIKTGEVTKAISLAKNMCELPRHPKYNTLDKGSAMFGRNRLLSIFTTYGLWETLISHAETPYLEPTDSVARQDERLAWLAVANWMTGNEMKATGYQGELSERWNSARSELSKLTKELQAIEANKPPSKPKSGSVSARSSSLGRMVAKRAPSLELPLAFDAWDWGEVEAKKASDVSKEPTWDETVTKNWTKPQQAQAKEHKKLRERVQKLHTFLGLAEAYRAASHKRYGEAIVWARTAGSLVPTHDRIEWYWNDGRKDAAIAKCRDRIQAAPGEVIPLSLGAWIAWNAADEKQAREWLNDLSKIAFASDRTVPLLARLEPIADKLQLNNLFDHPPVQAEDLGERPSLESLGPDRWSPYVAPTWSLSDSNRVAYTSKQYLGKPTIMIFYLGLGCLHCVEQLQVFSPMADRFKEAGIEIIAVSTEDQASMQTGLANYSERMKIPLLTNPELDLFKSMRCYDDFEDQPLHGTFVLDREGRVVWQDIGPDPFMDADFLLQEVTRIDRLK